MFTARQAGAHSKRRRVSHVDTTESHKVAGKSDQQAAWFKWEAAVRSSRSASIEAMSHDLPAELFGSAASPLPHQSPSRKESLPATAAAQYLHDLPALPPLHQHPFLSHSDRPQSASASPQQVAFPVYRGCNGSLSGSSWSTHTGDVRASSFDSYYEAYQRHSASTGSNDTAFWGQPAVHRLQYYPPDTRRATQHRDLSVPGSAASWQHPGVSTVSPKPHGMLDAQCQRLPSGSIEPTSSRLQLTSLFVAKQQQHGRHTSRTANVQTSQTANVQTSQTANSTSSSMTDASVKAPEPESQQQRRSVSTSRGLSQSLPHVLHPDGGTVRIQLSTAMPRLSFAGSAPGQQAFSCSSTSPIRVIQKPLPTLEFASLSSGPQTATSPKATSADDETRLTANRPSLTARQEAILRSHQAAAIGVQNKLHAGGRGKSASPSSSVDSTSLKHGRPSCRSLGDLASHSHLVPQGGSVPPSESIDAASPTSGRKLPKSRRVSAPSSSTVEAILPRHHQIQNTAALSLPTGSTSVSFRQQTDSQTVRQQLRNQTVHLPTHRRTALGSPVDSVSASAERGGFAASRLPVRQPFFRHHREATGSWPASSVLTAAAKTAKTSGYLKCCSGSCAPSLQQSEQLCRPRPILKSVSMDALQRLSPTASPAIHVGSGNAFGRVDTTLEQRRDSTATWRPFTPPGNSLAACSAPALDALQGAASWHPDTWQSGPSAIAPFMRHGQRALEGEAMLSQQAVWHQEAAELAVHSGNTINYLYHGDRPHSRAGVESMGKRRPKLPPRHAFKLRSNSKSGSAFNSDLKPQQRYEQLLLKAHDLLAVGEAARAWTESAHVVPTCHAAESKYMPAVTPVDHWGRPVLQSAPRVSPGALSCFDDISNIRAPPIHADDMQQQIHEQQRQQQQQFQHQQLISTASHGWQLVDKGHHTIAHQPAATGMPADLPAFDHLPACAEMSAGTPQISFRRSCDVAVHDSKTHAGNDELADAKTAAAATGPTLYRPQHEAPSESQVEHSPAADPYPAKGLDSRGQSSSSGTKVVAGCDSNGNGIQHNKSGSGNKVTKGAAKIIAGGCSDADDAQQSGCGSGEGDNGSVSVSHTKVLTSKSYDHVLCLTKAMVADLLPVPSITSAAAGSNSQVEIQLVDPHGTEWPVTFRYVPSRYSYEFRAGWRAVALAWGLSVGNSITLVRQTPNRLRLHLKVDYKTESLPGGTRPSRTHPGGKSKPRALSQVTTGATAGRVAQDWGKAMEAGNATAGIATAGIVTAGIQGSAQATLAPLLQAVAAAEATVDP